MCFPWALRGELVQHLLVQPVPARWARATLLRRSEQRWHFARRCSIQEVPALHALPPTTCRPRPRARALQRHPGTKLRRGLRLRNAGHQRKPFVFRGIKRLLQLRRYTPGTIYHFGGYNWADNVLAQNIAKHPQIPLYGGYTLTHVEEDRPQEGSVIIWFRYDGLIIGHEVHQTSITALVSWEWKITLLGNCLAVSRQTCEKHLPPSGAGNEPFVHLRRPSGWSIKCLHGWEDVWERSVISTEPFILECKWSRHVKGTHF